MNKPKLRLAYSRRDDRASCPFRRETLNDVTPAEWDAAWMEFATIVRAVRRADIKEKFLAQHPLTVGPDEPSAA